MAEHGLLIEYNFCTGCMSCEVACQQEHNHPTGQSGIRVTEYVMDTPKGLAIDNLPFPTALCDLCAARTGRGEQPACVKHCQASCMRYGLITELAEEMARKPRTVIFRPR
jgi:anaerobic dimethyl sulfoxide reductase subunit B (iron-sulfur subunit)